MAKQVHIFATMKDLEPGLRQMERRSQIRYARCGTYATEVCEILDSLLGVESLGINNTGDHIGGDCYLVFEAEVRLVMTRVLQQGAGTRFILSQDGNEGSITFQPGGIYRGEALVCGHIGTIWETAQSTRLYRAFVREITKGYRRVKAYYVGPDAMELLKKGVLRRLITMGVDEPPEYDLKV